MAERFIELQRFAVNHVVHLLVLVLPGIRCFVMQQLIEEDPEAPYVNSMVVALIHNDLRSHVIEGPTVCLTCAVGVSGFRRPAEVAEFYIPLAI